MRSPVFLASGLVGDGDPLAVRWSGYVHILSVLRPQGPSRVAWVSEAHPGTGLAVHTFKFPGELEPEQNRFLKPRLLDFRN